MLNINNHTIITNKTAHYYSIGELSSETSEIWFVFHGYGQLASNFIQKFEPFVNKKRFIIAPEGLSRFYLDAKYETVGASWMTKVDRISEINDQITFLNNILQTNDLYFTNIKITLFGFSQGCATLWRWLAKIPVPVQRIILWAGSIPEEPIIINPIVKPSIHIVYGLEDELVKPADKNQLNKHKGLRNLHYTIHYYNGKHQIKAVDLKDIMIKIL